MQHLVLALSVILLLPLAGWGQITPGEQARASVAGHRQEAKDNARRRHHHRGRRHNHRRHPAA